MNNEKKLQDLKLGTEGEDYFLPIFREKFDKYLCKTNRYSQMDYISPTTIVELKTRNCKSTTYPNIMIGKNKIEFSLKSKKKCILAFTFQDGIYYWEVNKDNIDSGEVYYKTFEDDAIEELMNGKKLLILSENC